LRNWYKCLCQFVVCDVFGGRDGIHKSSVVCKGDRHEIGLDQFEVTLISSSPEQYGGNDHSCCDQYNCDDYNYINPSLRCSRPENVVWRKVGRVGRNDSSWSGDNFGRKRLDREWRKEGRKEGGGLCASLLEESNLGIRKKLCLLRIGLIQSKGRIVRKCLECHFWLAMCK